MHRARAGAAAVMQMFVSHNVTRHWHVPGGRCGSLGVDTEVMMMIARTSTAISTRRSEAGAWLHPMTGGGS